MAQDDVVIMGGGPAGLAAGCELVKNGKGVICLEKDDVVGGISKTIVHNDFRFDVGGHRFFTKIPRVDDLWHKLLGDDFLRCRRLSRIYYKNRFFSYPLKPMNALMGLGVVESFSILASYFYSKARPFPSEENFEQWVSNRFGRKLFRIFFKSYTEKVWGMSCDRIAAEWAAQRIKGLSLSSAVKAALWGDRNKSIKTLVEEFDYPRLGAGQVYEAMAGKISQAQGRVLTGSNVVAVNVDSQRIVSVEVADTDGQRRTIEGRYFLSSIPVTELVRILKPGAPAEVIEAAEKLAYRSLLMVNLMLKEPASFPDNWIYIHSHNVKVGRVQCFGNWSGAMLPGADVSSLSIEYFCDEGDKFWCGDDEGLIELAKKEIEQLRLGKGRNVFDAFVVRCAKAYPVYSMDYAGHLETVRNYLAGFSNLQCIGRNGMFKYNNMDHSVLSGLLAADNIMGADNDLCAINVEQEYHEEQKG